MRSAHRLALALALALTGAACGGRIAPEPAGEAPEPPAAPAVDASLPGYADAPAACTTMCHGACVDVLRDPQNCGACGRDCPTGGVCADGVCVGAKVDAGPSCSGAICGGACVDIFHDPQNCGGCGRACDPTQTCFRGGCVCSFGNPCDGTCVDHLNDHENCGFCEFPCASDQTCIAGHCV